MPPAMPARVQHPIRIIVADDHPIVRKGLCQIVNADPALRVVAEAATADEALSVARKTACDVVVLDLGMPGAVGLSALKALREHVPGVPVLILSMASEDQFGARAIRAGAAGYVSKRSAPDQLVEAIHRVVAGGLHVSSATGRALAQDLLMPPPRVGASAFRLSDRELEVLRMLGAGLSGEAIAARLDVSSKTISTYRKRLLTKLGLDSTAALIRYAIEQGIGDD